MKVGIKRVDWQMGQMLLPHHLIAQEESLFGYVSHLIKLVGIPYYGIAQLNWDEDLFIQGIVSISELSLIFPSRQLIDVPRNAMVSSFDLNSTGKSEVTLYLHIVDEKKQNEEEIQLMEETAKVSFFLYQILLSPQKNLDSSRAVFKLAHFEKSLEGEWKLSEQYIPPLITLSKDPFLNGVFSKILRVVEGVKKKLEREMENPGLFAFQNFEWRLCLMEIVRLQRFCANNIKGQVTLHPFFLYEKLCQLLDCTSKTEYKIPTYDHENLAALYDELIHKIEHSFINEQKDFSYIEFERKDSSYIIEHLPSTISKAKEVYLIVHKPDAKSYFNAASLQLTSRLRLAYVRHYSISGITLTSIRKPAFLSTNFGDEIEAYLIDQKEEWKKAIAEENLMLFHQDLTPDFHIFLYWRNIDGTTHQIQ